MEHEKHEDADVYFYKLIGLNKHYTVKVRNAMKFFHILQTQQL